ncbi:MAG: CBS domain-containing protein [Haloarculaceae archaeon]
MLVSVTVREVMRPGVVTTAPSTTVRAAAKTLIEEDIGSVVVTDDGETVGIVTKTDVTACLARDADADAVTVDEVMSAPVETIAASENIEQAAELLRKYDVNQLPVTDEGDLVGVVNVTHLSYYLPQIALRSFERPARGRETRTESGPGLLYEATDWTTEHVCRDPDRISVGDVVRFSKTLDDEDVFDFADATGDTNRLHLDDAYAEETRFQQRIVHGVLTVGVVSAALARLPGLVIYISQQSSFQGPVAVGDHVTAVCEVVEDLDGDRYRLSTRVLDGDDDPVLHGESTVLIDALPESERREPAAVPTAE